MKKLKAFYYLIILFSLYSCNNIIEIHVSHHGNNSNAGTKDSPLQTLEKAHELALGYAKEKETVIYLHEGKYYLTKTLAIKSGQTNYPVRYTAYNNESVTVSGSKTLNALKWEVYEGNILYTDLQDSLIFDQLYVNGVQQHMARYPDYDEKIRHFNGYSPDATLPERINNKWTNPAGGYLHAMHNSEWGGYHYLIEGKDEKGELQLKGGFQNNRKMGMHKNYRMVENIFEELDAEGEWYYNRIEKKLYYYPPKDLDLNNALFEIPQLESLFYIEGSEKEPVENITISNLGLEHTLRTFMKTSEPLLRSDWTIYRSAAIMIEGGENCLIENCFIHDVGGNAVFFSKYNNNNTVKNTHITRAGASGICFVGSPDAVRSPSFEYGKVVDIQYMDTITGPLNNNFPINCISVNNLIHDIGMVEKQVAGIQISMAKNITVTHNSIYNLPRAGINIGDGTWGGHVIEWNDVFNTVLETGDHGSFNSWGRDRFWHPNRSRMDSLNKALPHFAEIDAIETTIIRNNRWRCDHGWDIDLDDGSSNYHIYNNLCLNGGLKLREGFNRIVENNIMINDSFHPHVWFKNSGDIFMHNIVTRAYRPIGIRYWGKEVDYNLFPDDSSLKAAQNRETDKNSLAGDPLFVNPDIGDYRVKGDSPALRIGFKNFDMDKFGVQYGKLKEIAAKPVLPAFEILETTEMDEEIHNWLGGKVKNLSTLGEQSATGMDAIRGVIVIDVEEGSILSKGGIKPNDVILNCNGRTVDRWNDLNKIMTNINKEETLRIVIFRNQTRNLLNIKMK